MRHRRPTREQSADGSFAQAWEASLRLLSYRARSQAEISRRLAGRFSPEVIEQVVAALEARGYLNDAAFAREWRSSRERLRPRGEALIRQELLGFGIAPDTVGAALEDFDPYSNAYRAGQKLARRLTSDDFQEFRKRLWAHLQRRGFPSGVISQVVADLWRELTQLLHGDVNTGRDEQQSVEAEEVQDRHGEHVGHDHRHAGGEG